MGFIRLVKFAGSVGGRGEMPGGYAQAGDVNLEFLQVKFRGCCCLGNLPVTLGICRPLGPASGALLLAHYQLWFPKEINFTLLVERPTTEVLRKA